MKRLLSTLIVMLMLTSCGSQSVSVAPQKVNTIILEESQIQNYTEYSGYLLSSELKKYSFTQGGQILSVNVKKGDEVKEGDVLATLDPKLIDLAKNNAAASQGLAENQSRQADINLEALQKSLEAEKIILSQAEDGLNAEILNLESLKTAYEKSISQLEYQFEFLEDNYEKNKVLLESGAISQLEFNNIKIEYDSMKEELEALYKDYSTNENLQNIAINNARNNIEAQKIKLASIEDQISAANISKVSAELQVEQADIGLEQYVNQIEDMTLKATKDGAVVQIVMNEGEVTGAGTPIVVVKSNTTVVKVGVPIESYKDIKLGQQTVVTFNDTDFEGVVTGVASYPDETTKTYEIEVEVEENDIPLGSLVNVKFPVAETAGTYIPINSIINRSGVNYVYTVNEEGLVEKREVVLGEVFMDKVEVKGLDFGTILIVDNFRQLRENDEVIVE